MTPDNAGEGKVGKCTSWLGHKFEARYSTSAAKLTQGQMDELFWLGSDAKRRLSSPTRTYEGDVCVRCGALVNKDHTA